MTTETTNVAATVKLTKECAGCYRATYKGRSLKFVRVDPADCGAREYGRSLAPFWNIFIDSETEASDSAPTLLYAFRETLAYLDEITDDTTDAIDYLSNPSDDDEFGEDEQLAEILDGIAETSRAANEADDDDEPRFAAVCDGTIYGIGSTAAEAKLDALDWVDANDPGDFESHLRAVWITENEYLSLAANGFDPRNENHREIADRR